MEVTRLSTFLFTVIAFVLFESQESEAQRNDCIHSGCRGIPLQTIPYLARRVKIKASRDGHYPDNIMRIATWNISGIPVPHSISNKPRRPTGLCLSILKMGLTLFSLQGVDTDQLNELKRCLRRHTFLPNAYPTDGNLIGFRKQRRLLTHSAGQFYLSETPYEKSKLKGASDFATCTWAKLSFANVVGTRNETVETVYSKLLGLLKHYSSQRRGSARRETRQLKVYRYFTFYTVNVAKVDDQNKAIAKEQMKICLDHLYNVVMERRRYPLIVAGRLNWESSFINSNIVTKNENFNLKNGMEDSGMTYYTFSTIDKEKNIKELKDYITYNGFNSLLTAVLVNRNTERGKRSINRPVVSFLYH